MTDRPSSHAGCVNLRTKETYESELSMVPEVAKPEELPAIARSTYGEWYSGGNLHDSSIGEWKRGTSDNRLATAGDFAATIMKGRFDSMLALKVYAIELETCISRAVEGVNVNHESVKTIAASCAIIMGWK